MTHKKKKPPEPPGSDLNGLSLGPTANANQDLEAPDEQMNSLMEFSMDDKILMA